MVAKAPFPGSDYGKATLDDVAYPNVVAIDPQLAELDRAKRSLGVEKLPMTRWNRGLPARLEHLLDVEA